MNVLKRNGEKEPFNENKFKDSLSKAGFSENEINSALKKINLSFFDGISTDEIYERAWDVLKDVENIEPVVKYSLKRAILELGPSGFPFEQLVSRIYEEKGYKTMTGVILQGKCIEHEIDVLAYKGEELILMEAKFHNEQSMKSDTKVALYVKARFDDLSDINFEIEGQTMKLTRGVLITNTSFTNNSKKYVKCSGTFDMISWAYPKGKGLLQMIEEQHIHPITSIPLLSKREKTDLIESGFIYCKDIVNDPSSLEKVKITGHKRDEVLEMAKSICKYTH